MNREMTDQGRRVLGIVTAAVALLIVAGFVILVWPRGGNSVTVAVDSVPAGGVVYYSSHGFFLVREGNQFTALNDMEPDAKCRVTWRSDLLVGTLTGAFRSPCTGRTYDRQGTPIGDGKPLQMFPVVERGDNVVIEPARSAEG